MLSTRVRIKLLLLIILGVSAVGLTRATGAESCAPESCAVVVENGQPVGYGCVAEGAVSQKCTATLRGCAYEACSLLD
jgi:hypothetical protein